MFVNRREAWGLGDLASALKRGQSKQAGPSIAKTLTVSQNSATFAKANTLGRQLASLNSLRQGIASGNINPAFQPAPTDAQIAQAQAAYNSAVSAIPSHLRSAARLTAPAAPASPTSAPSTMAPIPKLMTSVAGFLSGKPLTAVQQPAVTPAVIAATQQALTATPAPTPAITPSGGGGGGGGAADTSDPSTLDATMPDEPTGWAALGTGTKAAIIGGGAVALFLGWRMMRHHG